MTGHRPTTDVCRVPALAAEGDGTERAVPSDGPVVCARAERVLIIRPSALGDVCRSVPVLASLRRAFPRARIDWLVQAGFEEAVSGHPDLSGVVAFDRRGLSGWWRKPRGAKKLAAFVRTLRSGGYDLVIDAQGLFRSAVFSAATAAKTRVAAKDAAEMAWLAANVRVEAPVEMHTVDRMLRLVEAIGVEPVRDMRLYPPAVCAETVSKEHPWTHEPFAVLAPTSRWAGKAWPSERFAELAARVLRDKPGGVERVAIVGAGGERPQCGPLLEMAERDGRVVDLLGKTSVGGLMEVIRRAKGLVANDSAALHMAVGLGTPYVALFGPTRLDRVGPYTRGERPAARGETLQHVDDRDTLDHKDAAGGRVLMERLSVEDVGAAVERVLAEAATSASEQV